MTIDRVRLSRHLLGRVSQSFRRGGRGNALGDRVIACHRAEFSLELGPAVDAFARTPGIEKLGPVLDLGRGLWRERQRVFEPVLADIAPRADHVGHDVDMHAR